MYFKFFISIKMKTKYFFLLKMKIEIFLQEKREENKDESSVIWMNMRDTCKLIHLQILSL